MKNLELKTAGVDFGRARRVLRTLKARRQAQPLVQSDWYFVTPRGRLKLRQRKGERRAELIFYVRPDAEKARASEYEVLPTEDGARLLRLLRAMFTPGVCVRKRRELWLLGETRVHLDRVDGLGEFLEIEVPYTGAVAPARVLMRMLIDRLGIDPAQVLGCSYSDLLAQRSAGAERAHRKARAARKQ
jgi:adenylate cyclase class IV